MELREAQAEKATDLRRKLMRGLSGSSSSDKSDPLVWQPSPSSRAAAGQKQAVPSPDKRNQVPLLASFNHPPPPRHRPANQPPPEKPKPLKVNLDLLNYYARKAQAQRNFSLSVELWERCLAMDSSDGRAWLGLARHALNSKKGRPEGVERSREIYADGLAACPENPYLLQALGVLEEKQGDFPRAMELYKEAIRCDPSHAASWVSRGKLESRLRRTAEARVSFRKACEAQPSSYYAWQCWAVLEQEARNFKEARLLFQRSVDANPRNAATFQSWGVFESKQGNLENATQLFRRGLKCQPRNTHILQAWAGVEGRLGNTRKAVELFEKAIEIRPSDAALFQAYAVMCADLGDLEGARRLFALGTKADKTHLKTYQTWGLLEAEQGNLEDARRVFQQGAWAAPRGKGITELWQAWALTEAAQGYPTEESRPLLTQDLGATDRRDSSGKTKNQNEQCPLALQEARKYFQFALDAAQQAYPSRAVVSWAKVEERYGYFGRARALFEAAAAADPSNKRLWAAFDAFEGRRGSMAERQKVNSRANFASISALTTQAAQVRSALEAFPAPQIAAQEGINKSGINETVNQENEEKQRATNPQGTDASPSSRAALSDEDLLVSGSGSSAPPPRAGAGGTWKRAGGGSADAARKRRGNGKKKERNERENEKRSLSISWEEEDDAWSGGRGDVADGKSKGDGEVLYDDSW